MNENQIDNLLKQADDTLMSPSAVNPADLSIRARRRAAMQSRRRTAIAGTVTALLILAACLVGYNQHQQKIQQRIAMETQLQQDLAQLKADTAATLAEIKALNKEYKTQVTIADMKVRLETIRSRIESMENQSEQLAARLYNRAQSLSNQENTCTIARDLYLRIVETFPKTTYYDLAQQQLAQLNCFNGS